MGLVISLLSIIVALLSALKFGPFGTILGMFVYIWGCFFEERIKTKNLHMETQEIAFEDMARALSVVTMRYLLILFVLSMGFYSSWGYRLFAVAIVALMVVYQHKTHKILTTILSASSLFFVRIR